MKFKKLHGTIREQVEKDNAMAEIAKQRADIDYIAMMSDVEIPTDESEVEIDE